MTLTVSTTKSHLKRYRYKRGKGVVSKQQKIAKDVAKIKKEMKSDTNYILIAGNAAAGYDGALNFAINAIAMGGSIGQREGPRITAKSLDMMFNIYPVFTAGAYVPATVRIMLVQEKIIGTTGSTLGNYITYPGSVSSPISSLNQPNRKKFVVLYDKVTKVHGDNPIQTMRVRVNLRNKITEYSGDTSGSAQNNYYRVFVFSDVAPASNPPNVYYAGVFNYDA